MLKNSKEITGKNEKIEKEDIEDAAEAVDGEGQSCNLQTLKKRSCGPV